MTTKHKRIITKKILAGSFFIILLFLSIDTLFAQRYTANAQFFDASTGLLDNTVSAIYQDKTGFIWLGTRFGLHRFDGYEFKIWKGTDYEVNLERISRIGQDDAGWLWLWNDVGVVFFDPTKEVFLTPEERFETPLPFQTTLKILGSWRYWENRIIPKDEAGRLLFFDKASQQLITFKGVEGFRQYSVAGVKNLELQNTTAGGIIWGVADKNKIVQLSNQGQVLQQYQLARNQTVIGNYAGNEGVFFKIQLGKNEESAELWYMHSNGTFTQVPIKVDVRTTLFYNKIAELLFIFNEGKWLIYDDYFKLVETIPAEQAETHMLSAFLNCHYVDRSGKNWIGNDFGLALVSIEPNKFRNYFSFRQVSNKPYNNSARGILAKDDRLWVNFEMGGLTKIQLNKNKLNDYQLLDRKEGFSKIPQENGRYSYWGRAIFADTPTTLWVGSDEALRKYDTLGNLLASFPLNESINDTFFQKDIWSLHQDANRNIWIGTGNGLSVKQARDSSIQKIKVDYKWGLPRAIIFDIVPASPTNYWLCTSEGLFLFDSEQRAVLEKYSPSQPKPFYIPVSNIRHLHQDKTGIYWLASTQGMLRWDRKTNQQQYFNSSSGLVGEVLTAIYEDKYKHLWIASDKSIMRMNKDNYQVIAYLERDGTQGEYNRIAHYQNEDGTLFFGGINGVTVFHPSVFYQQKNKTSAPLVISKYEHFNGDNDELQKIPCAGNEALTIQLQPNDKFFTLELANLNFEGKDLNSYAYKMEGIDAEWIHQDSRKFWFGRLPYGRQRLQLLGIDKRNNLANTLTVDVQVLKPFYLQTWFLVLMSTSVMVAAYGVSHWRTNQLRRQKRLLELEVQKATNKILADKEVIAQQANSLKALNQTKDRLFAIISHDLRKPALAFRGISKKVKFLIQQKEFATLDKYGNTLENAAYSLNSLLDNLLNWALTQRDVLPHQPVPFNVAATTSEVVRLFDQMAADKNIKFQVRIPESTTIFADPNAYATIVRNLVDNALKFTPKKG
ncbi:MAG: two-component regulator propeller domain-containing protein, partial [Bacteroidota bacterium]